MELGKVALEVAVEDALLMRVLAVAQYLAVVGRQAQRAAVLSVEVAEDRRIIARADREGAASEVTALLEARLSSLRLEDVVERSVVGLGGNDDHVLEVLRRPTDEADTTDVNLLNDILLASARGYRGLEGIEVYDHQVDQREAVLGDLLLVGSMAATSEDTALDGGVQRLDTPPEHRGVLRQILDGHAGIAEGLDEATGTSRGYELYARLMQQG